MSKFEVFNDEEQLFRRIDQLRIDGIKDEDITIIADDKLDRQSIIYTTSVNFKKSRGTLWDRAVSKLNDDNSHGRVRDQLNLSEDDKIKYNNALDAGSILLFAEGLTHTEEVNEDSEDDMGNPEPENESAEETEDSGDIQDDIEEISKDEEKETDEVIQTANGPTATKEYDGITVTTESEEADQSAVNEIKTDEDTHRLDMRTFVTKYDEALEEEEEAQEAEEDTPEKPEQKPKVFYHTVKNNVVNMNPEDDESGIKKG